MTRLATGIQGFDGMVQGGLPLGSSVILQGPPGQEKLQFALTFLAEGLKSGASGVIVISSQSPDSALAELRTLGVDLDAVMNEGRLRIVDWYSWSEETVKDVEERGIVVRSSVDLTNLGVALSRAITAVSKTDAPRAVIEMLSPATNIYETTQVYAFAQSAKKKFDRFGFTSLVLLEKDMHSGSGITTLHQPFDGVIEIERTRSGDRIVRKIGVLHLKDTAPDPTFRILEVTESGLRVVRETARPSAEPSVSGIGSSVLESQGERGRRLSLIMQIASERLKLDPKDADALFAMAAAQATLDDPRAALQSLDRLAGLDPNYPGLWVLKTKLHARLGEADRARESRLQAQRAEGPETSPARSTVPCPMCDAPVAENATVCGNCGVKFAATRKLEDELEDLGRAAIQDMVQEEMGQGAPLPVRPEPGKPKPVDREPPVPAPKPELGPPSKSMSKKGLTNGLVLSRSARRRAGMTNGLKGRTNGLRGRTNGLTNGLGRTNGLTNGLGRTNGLTNGVGRTNGLTNGLGRTNGLTNGLGRTNGLTNGLGRTNGMTNGLAAARPMGFRSTGFRGMMRTAGWKLYVIPLVVVGLLLMPLFMVPEYRGPSYPIQIDGQFNDWATVATEAMASGTALNANIDVTRFGAVSNLGPFAFYVEVAGSALMGGGSPGTMDTVRIFVDIDASASTGYRIDGLGADRLIEVSGHDGAVLSSTLWEFDSNRNQQDWNGWIKGTATPAAASGSRIEAEAEWLAGVPASVPIVATVHTTAWDAQTDRGDFPLSPGIGTLSIVSDPQLPDVLAGSSVSLLRLTLTAHGQPVTISSVQVEIAGTAPANSVTSLAMTDGVTTLSQVVPTSRNVLFSFAPIQIAVDVPTSLSVVGDFASTTGQTFGVRLPSDHPFGVGAGVVALRENAGTRTLGYLGFVPSAPRVDGAFDEWTALSFDPMNDVGPRGNSDIDLGRYGAQRGGAYTFLYVDVAGRIFQGTPTPENPRQAPPQGSQGPADTDRDGVPDTVDSFPQDFNNDGTSDVQTNGDYDGDGIVDYGFSGGTDFWLNTTIPNTFPAPYAGRPVTLYIGPDNRPPALGEDVIRIFLDIDGSTFSGYAIGGVGADRLVEIRGKDGDVTQSALLGFAGSFPGEWEWTPISPVTVALGFHAVELSVPVNGTNVYVEASDFWGSVDSTAAEPALAPKPTSFKVSAAASPLSVPWTQVGPQPASRIDLGSNAVTTTHNQQRKVVRAGDTPGAACDATNSDGCWYVVFSDQFSEATSNTQASTEVVTIGSKVSGLFPTAIQTADNVSIQYRESLTPTISSKNPTAVGSNPACAWNNCANAKASDNAYADRTTEDDVLSLKTFGFNVPSGSAITQVRFGIEAYQGGTGSPDDQMDIMTLSWNGGTNYCGNTFTITPGAADPNAYTYFDQTSCTGHSWAPTDFSGDNIAWKGQYHLVANPARTVFVDAIIVEVTYNPPASYQEQVRYDWSGVPSGDAYTLKVKGYRQDEDVNVQVLTPPSSWVTKLTITATTNTLYSYDLTTPEYNSGSPSIRFVDAAGADSTQSDFWIDYADVATNSLWDRVILMRSNDTSGSSWGSQVILASGRSTDNPIRYLYDSAEPSIAMDSGGFLHVVWVSAASAGNQKTMNLVRYTKSTVAWPTQNELATGTNWEVVTPVDDTNPGYMPTVSTDTGGYPHIAWSQSKTVAPEAAGVAYRSSTGTDGINSLKTRSWDGSAWGPEVEQPNAGSPVRVVRSARSPIDPDTSIVVTQGDDAWIDAYVCTPSCTVTSNVGQAGTAYFHSFEVAFEQSSGDALLVWVGSDGNTTHDIRYMTYTGGAWSALQWYDDPTGPGPYGLVELAPKKGSDQIGLVGGDANQNDITALIWDGSAFTNFVEVNTGSNTPGYENAAIAWESNSGHLLVVSADAGSTTCRSKVYTTSWQPNSTFTCGGTNTIRYLNLKANPVSTANDMVLSVSDLGQELSTVYWTGSAWNARVSQDPGVDEVDVRSFDFAWEATGSKGLLVYATTAGQLASKSFTAPSTWTSLPNVGAGANTHRWVQARTNPNPAGAVKILGDVWENTANDLGAWSWDGSTLTMISTTAFTADTGSIGREAYDLEYRPLIGGYVYYKNQAGGGWKATVSWGPTYTGLSVDVSPQNNYVSLARYKAASTNEIQYTVCKDLSTSNCDSSTEIKRWDGTAGYDTVATGVETTSYPSLVTTYEANGDVWIAYVKVVDGTTRSIQARFLDYPSGGWAAAENVDSISGTIFTRPSIGVDRNNNVHALYVATSGPQLYYNERTTGWGTRAPIDAFTDNPTILLRAPNDVTYGSDSGGLYWKTSTSETYFYYISIPEFGELLFPIAGVLCLVLILGLRARSRSRRVSDAGRHA
jgi:KaiC/GvpD/RAD55 family RecA-like ATPase